MLQNIGENNLEGFVASKILCQHANFTSSSLAIQMHLFVANSGENKLECFFASKLFTTS